LLLSLSLGPLKFVGPTCFFSEERGLVGTIQIVLQIMSIFFNNLARRSHSCIAHCRGQVAGMLRCLGLAPRRWCVPKMLDGMGTGGTNRHGNGNREARVAGSHEPLLPPPRSLPVVFVLLFFANCSPHALYSSTTNILFYLEFLNNRQLSGPRQFTTRITSPMVGGGSLRKHHVPADAAERLSTPFAL